MAIPSEFRRFPMVRPLMLAVLLLVLGVGRTYATDIAEGLADHSVASWAEADGRALGSVYAIAQASDGYLWIGSDAGLFRFDGWRFVHWDGLSESPLPKAPVSAVCVARDGSIWVGFVGMSGLQRLREGRIVPADGGVLEGPVAAIAEDMHGTLWAIAGGTVYRREGERWRRLPLTFDPGERLSQIVNLRPAKTGGMYVLTSRGAFKQERSSDIFRRVTRPVQGGRLEGWTWDLDEGADGSLWTTDMAAGFKRREPPSGDWLQPTPRVMGYRLLRDRQDGLWVGTIGEGLWHVVPARTKEGWLVERITLNTGLTSNSVQSVVEDHDGNVWVGTTAGLHRLSRRKVTPIGDVALATSIDALPSGEMLVGTSNGLLAFRRTAEGVLQRRAVVANGPWVITTHDDHFGRTWIATTDGAYLLSGEQLRRVPGVEGLPVRFVASTRTGRVWFGSGDTVFRMESGRAVPFDIPRAWGISRISTMFADSRGHVWVTALDGQAGIISSDESYRAFGAADGLKEGSVINGVFEDRERTIWLATNAGLARFTGTRFEYLGQAQGLPTDRVGAVVDDDDGQLWLNIDIGLLRLDRTEFAKAVRTPGYRPRYRIYDASEGLSGAAIVQVKAARSTDGTLWFVRGGGVTFVDLRQLHAATPPRKRIIRIDAASADDVKLPASDVVSVPPGVKTLQVTYSALELGSPQRLRFRYRLDGFDLGWTEAGTRRQAFYTNLPPREYVFRVEARMDGERWVDATTWRFAIQPMFYQTSWFYAVLAGGILVTAWAAWHVRLRVVRHEFAMVLAERARLSREIHDTLLQSLVGLTLQINKVARNVVASPTEAASQLVRMRKEVEAYIRDARTSIWDLRSPSLETRDLPTALEELGARAACDNAVQFTTQVVGKRRRLSPKVENHLLRIGQEAITNAVRHANAGRIELELRFDERWLSLRVKDDGRGFEVHDVDRRDGHYGLRSMRERAMEIGAQFTVLSAPETGTEVVAMVPIGARAGVQ